MMETPATYEISHKAKLKNYYRYHSPFYDATRWSFLFGRQKLLDGLPKLSPQPRILEIGCGTGKNLEHMEFLFPDATIYGIDLSTDMLEKASERITSSGQITLINEHYGSRSLNLQPFDLILLSYTLTMIGNRTEAILQQIYEDLCPGGYIAVVDFHTTPFNWFKLWMNANHVNLDGQLFPLLHTYFNPLRNSTDNAYFGFWKYFTFLGKKG